MNKFIYGLIIVCLFSLLVACVKTQFGMPEEEWQQLNAEQKTLVIEAYNKRQALIEQRRLEKAQAKRESEALVEKQRYVQVERVKQGLGVLGDYIRISILSCQVKMGSKYRQIDPLSIKLADGEQRLIEIKSTTHKYTSYSKHLSFLYHDGLVTIGADSSARGGIILPYKQAWLKGHHYYQLSSKRPVKMKECEVEISIIPTRNRQRYY